MDEEDVGGGERKRRRGRERRKRVEIRKTVTKKKKIIKLIINLQRLILTPDLFPILLNNNKKVLPTSVILEKII